MTRRSSPQAIPPWGGAPVLKAWSMCPKFFSISSILCPRISKTFLSIKRGICSLLGREKGLCVNVHSPSACELSDLSVLSKKGKSTTQPKAREFLSFLSFLKSGLSVPYFSIASLLEILGKDRKSV